MSMELPISYLFTGCRGDAHLQMQVRDSICDVLLWMLSFHSENREEQPSLPTQISPVFLSFAPSSRFLSSPDRPLVAFPLSGLSIYNCSSNDLLSPTTVAVVVVAVGSAAAALILFVARERTRRRVTLHGTGESRLCDRQGSSSHWRLGKKLCDFGLRRSLWRLRANREGVVGSRCFRGALVLPRRQLRQTHR